jgi:hypothetical protein
MIHHISIPARDPEHVAKVLAELLAGYAGPFVGPIPGAWAAYAEDDVGTGIEVLPERIGLTPSKGAMPGLAQLNEPPGVAAFHALVTVKVDRAGIERIGKREGWTTEHFWRGPPGVKLFELYEFWVENRTLLELVTGDMATGYVKIANGPAQRALLARRPPPPGS